MSRPGSRGVGCGIVLGACAWLLVTGASAAPGSAEAKGFDGGGAAAGDPATSASVARPGAGSPRVVPPDLEDVEHMCALLTGCDRLPLPSGLVPRDFAGCTRALYAELASGAAVAFSLTLRDCGLRASSCTD